MLRATNLCRLYRTVINQLKWRYLLLMKNRHKILLRDHSVLESYLKTCLQHYTVSAVPETCATAQGPNRLHRGHLVPVLMSLPRVYPHPVLIGRVPHLVLMEVPPSSPKQKQYPHQDWMRSPPWETEQQSEYLLRASCIHAGRLSC